MAKKKGPFNTAEKFYIEQHCFTKEAKIIAEELFRTIEMVDDYINKYKANLVKMGGKMARHNGTTVMTQGASERGDDVRSSINRLAPISHCITKIKKDD